MRKTTGVSAPQSYGYKDGDVIKILFGPKKCKFLTPYPKALEEALTAPYPNYIHITSYKAGLWDGMYRFITKAGYFPTGLLPVVFCVLTTGVNPLIPENKKGRNVSIKPTKNVEIIPDKGADKLFAPVFLAFYNFNQNFMDNFNEKTGIFSYPVAGLKMWDNVKESNPTAKRILAFAKHLRENVEE